MITKQIHTDSASKLWDYYYKVRLPYLQSRSLDDIRKHGTVLSGNAAIDADAHKEWFTTMLSVAQMADYFKEDVPIRIVSQADVKIIYEHISEHIHIWKAKLERGINIGNAPIDDLVLLDRFANTIYDHAKYQFTPEIANSLMAQHLSGLQRVNAQNFFASGPLNDMRDSSGLGVTRINAAEDIPDRDSLADFFKNKLINLRRY